MRGFLFGLAALALVVAMAQPSYALGRRNRMMDCNTAPAVTAAKAENVQQISATRLANPVQIASRSCPTTLAGQSASGFDMASLAAMNVRAAPADGGSDAVLVASK